MRMIRSLWLVFFILIISTSQAQQTNSILSTSVDPSPGAPVILKGDTLFLIRASLGPFSKEDRATAINTRLHEITREIDFHSDSLQYYTIDNEVFITYKNRILTVVGRNDTIGTRQSMEEVAATITANLKMKMGERSRTFSIWRTLKNIGLTLLVISILGAIVWSLNRFFRWVQKWIDNNKAKIFRSITLQNYEFLTVEREYTITTYLLRVLKIIFIVLAFLIALPVIFSIFPSTEGITRKIIQLIWGPLKNILMGIVNYIPELITIFVIIIIFRYFIRFIKFLSLEVERKRLVIPGFHPEWAKPTYQIARVLLYAFMFIVIFPYLPGSESPIFRGVSVFLGVLISLGSTSLIGNAMAGIVITYMRPYKIGDRIKIDDIVGDVTEKTMMITRIRTIKNEDVTIPNAKVLSGYTVNYSSPSDNKQSVIIHTTVTIGYDVPWRKVHELLIGAAELTAGVIKDPKPFVLQTSLDDFYISYQINAFIKEPQHMLKIKSDLHQNILDNFNTGGVEIMSPHYRAERDGNEIAIPKNLDIDIQVKRETDGTDGKDPHDKKPK